STGRRACSFRRTTSTPSPMHLRGCLPTLASRHVWARPDGPGSNAISPSRCRRHACSRCTRPPLRLAAMPTQSDVRRWWADNPMTYDWRGEIPYAVGSAEHLAEVERRFLSEAWFAQTPGGPPFSGLIPYADLRDK